MLDFVPFCVPRYTLPSYVYHPLHIRMSCIQDAFIYLFSINSTMILCKFIAVSVFIIELGGLEENHIIHCTLLPYS